MLVPVELIEDDDRFCVREQLEVPDLRCSVEAIGRRQPLRLRLDQLDADALRGLIAELQAAIEAAEAQPPRRSGPLRPAPTHSVQR